MTPAAGARRLPVPPPRRGRGRPVGAVGEVARALLDQAAAAPGTARELARRALVGDRVGMYTVSRLASAGLLVKVLDSRPAVFAAQGCPEVCLLASSAADATAALNAFACAALTALMSVRGVQEPVTA